MESVGSFEVAAAGKYPRTTRAPPRNCALPRGIHSDGNSAADCVETPANAKKPDTIQPVDCIDIITVTHTLILIFILLCTGCIGELKRALLERTK